uniref:Uncharacterized protein n=1 Tax=Meloidogyne enterolobii TaxID=390850 RepID=A0A6V7XIR1_MELEN|nr:unnamed protein product [Meloidogyne enterolobii]
MPLCLRTEIRVGQNPPITTSHLPHLTMISRPLPDADPRNAIHRHSRSLKSFHRTVRGLTIL